MLFAYENDSGCRGCWATFPNFVANIRNICELDATFTIIFARIRKNKGRNASRLTKAKQNQKNKIKQIKTGSEKMFYFVFFCDFLFL